MVRSLSTITATLLLSTGSGCLLLADPPPFIDECVNLEIGEELGENLGGTHQVRTENTYSCGNDGDDADQVFEWTAPADGYYEFSIDVEDGDLGFSKGLGVTAPSCGGEAELCQSDIDESLTFSAVAGQVFHLVVWDSSVYLGLSRTDGTPFTISLTSLGTQPPPMPPAPCPHTNDRRCDEPEGTGLCAEGTDANDCTCAFEDDGECDEPEGTGLCAEGTDPYDC